MVKLWGARVARWGVLGLAALIVVAFFGRLIFQLEGRVHAESAGRQKAEAALAVDEAKLSVRDNLHVTVTAPAPQVTVMTPKGQAPTVITQPSSTRIIPIPSPFAVPGPTAPAPAPTPIPPPPQCPLLHILVICL